VNHFTHQDFEGQERALRVTVLFEDGGGFTFTERTAQNGAEYRKDLVAKYSELYGDIEHVTVTDEERWAQTHGHQ
jgi:hypothetical protein